MISLIADHERVLQRIDALTPESEAQWGKMNVAQMIAHCRKPLHVALGKLELKRGLIGFVFGRMAKRKFIDSDQPFNQNSPTDPKFRVADAREFENERAGLADEVRAFVAAGPPSKTHPFFGPMDGTAWDRLMWKHLDHHLRQFGV